MGSMVELITAGLHLSPRLNESLLRSNVFGLVFRYVSEPYIGLQVEVNVAGKGWKEVIDSAGTYTRKLNTVDIPVLAAFVAGKRTVRLAFTIGPYVSYLRSEKELIQVADTLYKSYYQKPLVHKLEFGFTGGVALEFYTKLGTFAVRGSYNHSLTNLFPLNIKEFYFSGSRNQVIQAGLMYFVNF